MESIVTKVEKAVEKEIKAEIKIVKEEIKAEIKIHPKRSTLTIILLFTLAVAFLEALRQFNFGSMVFIFVISLIICLPMIIGKLSKIDIPLELEIFAVLFIYAALFLGELKTIMQYMGGGIYYCIRALA